MQRVVFVCLVSALAGPLAAQRPATGAPPRPAPAPTTSPTQPSFRIAWLSSRTILDSTPGYAAAESTFVREYQGMRDELQKMQQQLDSASSAFDQALIALSPAAKETKRHELQQMQDRLTQRSNELDGRARQRNAELLGPYQSRVNIIIQGIRAEGNYALIFDADQANGIVSADPALNLTSKVIERVHQSP